MTDLSPTAQAAHDAATTREQYDRWRTNAAVHEAETLMAQARIAAREGRWSEVGRLIHAAAEALGGAA